MADSERVLDTLRQHYRNDCADANSGALLKPADVDAKFAEMTAALVAMLRDTEFGHDVRTGDWWDVVYRSKSLACGTIGICADSGGVVVTDADQRRTFRENALKAWIAAAIEDIFCTVSSSKTARALRVPWTRIGLVRRASNENLNTLIALHKSHVAHRSLPAGQKRLRPASPTEPKKRARATEMTAQFTLTACELSDTDVHTHAPGRDAEIAALIAEAADYRRQIAELELANAPAPACMRAPGPQPSTDDEEIAQLRQLLSVGTRMLENLKNKHRTDEPRPP